VGRFPEWANLDVALNRLVDEEVSTLEVRETKGIEPAIAAHGGLNHFDLVPFGDLGVLLVEFLLGFQIAR